MENPIVSVNIQGGLGNQMFQLATAYAYAKKYNGTLQIIKNKKYYDGRPLYWDSVLQRFQKYLVDSLPNNLTEWFETEATLFHNLPELKSQGIYFNGYLQSPKYFFNKDTENEIKNLFLPTEDILTYINNKYRLLLNNKDRIIIVHARRTDYLRNQDIINFHGPLPVEYYKEAIKKMNNYVQNPIYILASDDITFWQDVIKECDELNENNIFILKDENEITTLALLQQFNNFIIANSTFSWWAAYLSRECKKVIAPSKWFGPTGPKNYKDIYCSDWELV